MGNTAMDIYSLLASIKERPAMYLGRKSLTPLYHYLRGYTHGMTVTGYSAKRIFPDFDMFSSWVCGRDKSGYGLSVSWLTHIITVCKKDEEKAFERFFELFEEFKTTHPICERQNITVGQRIFYEHNHGSFWIDVFNKTNTIVIFRLVPGRTYWLRYLDISGNCLAEHACESRTQALADIKFNFAINNEWEKMSKEQSLAFLSRSDIYSAEQTNI